MPRTRTRTDYARRAALLLVLSGLTGLLLSSALPLAPQPSARAAAAVCQFPNFSAPVGFEVRSPAAVVAADLNNDQKLDLVTVAGRDTFSSLFINEVSVLLGDGAGGFGAASTFPTGRLPRAVAVGDFNVDGKPDLATANGISTQGNVSILLGDGAGAFAAPIPLQQTPVGVSANNTALAVADFNKDGKDDIVAVSQQGVSVSINDGTAHFTSKTFASGSSTLSSVVAGDFNADGNLDVAVSKGSSFNLVSLLLGDGAGNLGTATNFNVGSNPVSIIKGDFNKDNKLDVAVADVDVRAISVLLGDGAGGFAAARNIPSGGPFTVSIATGDFNGDGNPDLVAANGGPGGVLLLAGDGTGNFSPVVNIDQTEGGIGALFAADFNKDGTPDVAFVDSFRQRVFVMTAKCDAAATTPTFKFGGPLSAGEGQLGTYRLARTGDVTGTVSVDYATSDGTAHAGSDYTPAAGTLTFAPGETYKEFIVATLQDDLFEGIETFNLTLSNPTGGAALTPPNTTVVTLFDDEPTSTLSINSVVVPEGNSGTTNAVFTVSISHPSLNPITVHYETSDGLAKAGEDYVAASGTLTFEPGETAKPLAIQVKGDTLSEITESFFVTLTAPDGVGQVFFESPPRGVGRIADDDSLCPGPAFTPATKLTVGTSPYGLVAADFNGDNKPDLAATQVTNGGPVSIFTGNGAGGFTLSATVPAGSGPNAIVAADFTGDGKLDLATSLQGADKVALLAGNGAGGFSAPVNFTVGQFPIHIATADFNGDNKPDLATANITSRDISILINNGAGGFGAAQSVTSGSTATPIPGFVATGDFNGDNKTDLAVAYGGDLANGDLSSAVFILLGNGAGGFTQHASINVTGLADTLAVGDLNLDGKLDIVAPRRAFGEVSVLLGTGTGDFSAPTDFDLIEGPQSPVIADFNGDGAPDVAVAESTVTDSLGVLYGNGAGALAPRVSFPTGDHSPWTVVASDFNSDGRPDLAVTNFSAETVSVLLNGCGATPASVLQFGASAYTTDEANRAVEINVVRTGDTSGAATISYATSDDTASSRTDYTSAFGTLRFAPGETTKSFTVLLTDDALKEEPERVNLTLSNANGALLAGLPTATLTITDDDTPRPATNPVDDSTFFVHQHYHDFLNREPDSAGLAFWVNEIEKCGTDAQCREVRRINVSAAFFLSIEFQETGYLVERTYKTAYGDATSPNVSGTVPVVRLNEFLADTQQIGQGVQVGIGDWQGQLEANKQAYALDFVQRARFLAEYPVSMTAQQFMDKLAQNAGLTLTQAERDQLTLTLGATPSDASRRAQALRLVAENPRLRQAELNRAFVLMEYFGYLRRNPDDAPEPTLNFAGWKFWLTKLEQFNGNFVRAEMVKAFITSDEYRHRFGQ
jgi:hypothetical protein